MKDLLSPILHLTTAPLDLFLDPNVIIHVKRIAAGAIITVNNSSDADGKLSYVFSAVVTFLRCLIYSVKSG